MKKFLLLLMVSVFAFMQVGCKKDDILGEKTYKVSAHNVDNRGNYRFRFLKGENIVKEFVIAPGEGVEFNVVKGNYSWEALQISGYVVYPTKYGSIITIDRDRVIKF